MNIHTPNDTSDYETTRSVAPQATATLAEMELDHFVCSNSSTYSQTIAWTSANTSIATVNRSTGAVTGVDYGVTTITGTKTISGTTYTVSYKMVVSDLPVSGYELEYEPERWNTPADVDADNHDELSHIEYITNCYAYALNAQVKPGTNTLWDGVPGSLANDPIGSDETKSLANIVAAVQADAQAQNFRFESTTRSSVCPPGTNKVMLVIRQSQTDFHWYRQNSDGTWSHEGISPERF